MSKLFQQFEKMNPRERAMLGAFGVVLFVSLYFFLVLKPIMTGLKSNEQAIEKMNKRLSDLKSQYPEDKERLSKAEALEKNSNELKKKIQALELSLPDNNAVTEFSSEIIRRAAPLQVLSVNQKIDTEEAAPRFYLELQFRCSFEEFINYIGRIETLSAFLKVEEVQFAEAKKDLGVSGYVVTLTISTLMGDKPGFRLPAGEKAAPVSLPRDVFQHRGDAQAEATNDLNLQGITFFGAKSTALINGSVVRVGDKVDRFIIKEIAQDTVTVLDGEQEYKIRSKDLQK